MSKTSYTCDGFYYTAEMAKTARRIEAMTNPLISVGSFAGVAYMRNTNFGYAGIHTCSHSDRKVIK